MQMNVSLPRRMYDLVQSRVESGMYSNASEVVRDAIRRLDEEERRKASWKELSRLLDDAAESGRSAMSVSDVVDEAIKKQDGGCRHIT